MVECIFTIDYEIYGNGSGSLREHILGPMERIKGLFEQANVPCVVFVEVAELECIERENSDPDIQAIRRQIRELHECGFEIGLHIHPQWYNARYVNGTWLLDYGEYNLCTLSEDRIDVLIGRALAYLRSVLGDDQYTPVSFRAGNWLLQPTAIAARVLSRHGIRIDSSVFKGGLQRKWNLDYRRATANGWYWRFLDDVTAPSLRGSLLEVPIYTRMVPFWRMITGKRVRLQNRAPAGANDGNQFVSRMLDWLRFRYPLKFDFCRMTLTEQEAMLAKVMEEDRGDPGAYKPVALIGHTKDFGGTTTLEALLCRLRTCGISVSTLRDVESKSVATEARRL